MEMALLMLRKSASSISVPFQMWSPRSRADFMWVCSVMKPPGTTGHSNHSRWRAGKWMQTTGVPNVEDAWLQEAKDERLLLGHLSLNEHLVQEILLLPPSLTQVTEQTHLSIWRQGTTIQNQPCVQFPEPQAGDIVQLLPASQVHTLVIFQPLAISYSSHFVFPPWDIWS